MIRRREPYLDPQGHRPPIWRASWCRAQRGSDSLSVSVSNRPRTPQPHSPRTGPARTWWTTCGAIATCSAAACRWASTRP